MSQKILFFGLLFCFARLLSQEYVPIDTADYAKGKAFLTRFKKENDAYIKSLKLRYPGKTGNELEKSYREFYKDFEKSVRNKEYTFNSPFEQTARNILEQMRKANPEMNELTVLIAKDNTPNAFCLADNIFVVNMGLFNWMDNSSQIAAILCHETAHKLKEHTLHSLIRGIEESKNDRETLREISAMDKGKNDRAFGIVKNRLYKSLAEKRKSEIQADSLGYALYRKAAFKKAEFMNAMKNLRDFDSISPREIRTETYRSLYTLPNLPFNEKWLKKEDFSLYNYDLYKEKLDKDSISTHPEIETRIAMLEKEFPELKESAAPVQDDEAFNRLRRISRMEILPNFYQSEDYGMGVYAAMHFLQDGEEERYTKQWLGRFFTKIHEARQNYTLNRYLDRVDPKNQPESYQQFLNFMWNLSMDDIKKIADFYTKKEP